MPTPRPETRAENLASQLRHLRRSRRAQRTAAEGSARQLAVVAFTVPAVALVMLIVVMLTVLLLAGSGLTGLPSAIASSWLAIHQVPVTISGVTIGVLPLLPTLVVAAGTAMLTARAVVAGGNSYERPGHDLFDVGAVVFSAVIGPVLITAMSLAIVMDGGSVLPVQTPNPLVAFLYTLGVHGGGALAGIVWTGRRDFAARFGVTHADRRGFRYGLVAALMLFVAGAVLICIRMLMRHGQIGELIATGYDFDGFLGLTALSLLYLPNVMVAATAVLVGSDVQLGAMTVDLFTVRGGAVPPVPVLAVLPEGSGAGSWGLVGLLVPAGVAGFIAWRCRDLDPMAHVRSVGVAAAVAASMVAIATMTAGGELGEFGDMTITVSAAGVFTLGWVAVVGLLVVLVYAFLPSTRAARAAVGDDYFDDPLDPGYEDEYVIVTDLDEDDEYGGYEDADYEDAEFEDAEFEDAEFEDAEYEEAEYGDAEFENAADDHGDSDDDRDAGDHPATDGDGPRPVANRVYADDLDETDLADDADYDLYPGSHGASRRR
ncbi:cell division protein PerM [Gordonia terrae]|uniref:cell division protein PerM n=1 Tax=Gordonia terrae TaxID=2055 RepID=UPI003F6BDF17